MSALYKKGIIFGVIAVLFSLQVSSVYAQAASRLIFTIDGASGSITKSANYMTFSWDSENMKICDASASGNSTFDWSGPKNIQGNEQIFTGHPGTTNYKISCIDMAGKKFTKSIVVNVPPSPATPTPTSQAATKSTTAAANTASNIVCTTQNIRSFSDLIMNIVVGCIFKYSIRTIASIAVLTFLYGVFMFVIKDGEERQKGKQFIFYGIVGLFVIVSVYSMVFILQKTFGLTDVRNADITPRQVTIPTL